MAGIDFDLTENDLDAAQGKIIPIKEGQGAVQKKEKSGQVIHRTGGRKPPHRGRAQAIAKISEVSLANC